MRTLTERRPSSARLGVCGAIVGLLIAAALLPAAPAVAADDDDESTITVTIPTAGDPGGPGDGDITNAVLRWGINAEAGSGAFAGGCNFLSAGTAGNAGGAKVWEEGDGLYSAAAGNVEVVKAASDGSWAPASFATKCLDRSGGPVSVTSATAHTESQVVISHGIGRVDDAGADIRWSGSFTAVMYGGMTYWSASDPHLVMDAQGDGRVTASLSGFGTDREDMGKWVPIEPREVVIAEIRGATMTPTGFAQAPEYVGVTSAVQGQVAQDWENLDHWGAFPASFMQFQEVVGQSGYWMTTGGQRDRAKVATTLYVSYDASVPIDAAPGPSAAPSGAVAQIANPVSQRQLTAGGAIVPAAVQSASAGPALPTTQAATVVRDDGSSFIPQAIGGLPPFALPGALTLLSALVGTLSILHLAGSPLLPWLRRP